MNQKIFETLFTLGQSGVIMKDLAIFLSLYLPYILAIGFVVFALSQKIKKDKWLMFIEGLLAVILARGIITESVRFFYHSLRPFEALGFEPLIGESGYSFPSGHMTFFFALATALYFWNKRWGLSFMLLTLFIGVGRVMAGVHWPTDILGGIVVGFFSGVLIHLLLRSTLKTAGPHLEEAPSSI